VSNAICGRPGLSEAIAASISWLTASTFAPMFCGVPKGRTGWMVIRCSMSSMNPAVPGVFPCR
jgi:hypothetical protein